MKKLKCDCLLVCGKVNRGLIINNKLYSQILDTIGDELNNLEVNTVSIGWEHENFRIEKSFYGKSLNLSLKLLSKRLLYKISSIYKNNPPFLEEFYLDLFAEIQPKYIIGILPSIQLCISAKKLGIKVFDIQHGVIGSYENEFYTLKYREKYFQNGWPDYILTWNQNTSDWVNKNFNKYTDSFCIGNPMTIKFNNTDINDFYKKNNINFYNQYLYHNNKKILLTLGYNLTKYGLNSQYGLTKELIDVIKKTDDYLWLIRVHPVILRSKNSELIEILNQEFYKIKNRVEWELSSTLPLPIILKEVDFHITTISATCIEADLYGIKTGMLADEKVINSLYQTEVSTGVVFSIKNNTNEILKTINGIMINSKNKNITDTNFKKFINGIKNKTL